MVALQIWGKWVVQNTVLKIQGDQKVSVDLMITIQKAAAQRLFDHPVQTSSHQAPQ